MHKTLGKIVFPAFTNLIWQLPRNKKCVYLTFDDGPFPPATEEILKILSESRAPATFFLNGKSISEHRNDLSDLDYRGHILGNHGFFHNPYFFVSGKKLEKEIRETDHLIAEHFAVLPRLFRPPYGVFGPGVLRTLEFLNKDMVLWSLMSNDFKWSASRIFSFLRENLESGDIVVFHDSPQSQRTTLKVLPEFLKFCRAEGYEFLTF